MPARDYATTEAFDLLDRAWRDGRGNSDQSNDAPRYARLAWGESYFLQGYLLMHLARRRTDYLDRFAAHAGRVLASRDHERGVSDFRGRSLPVWRARDPYTVGATTLADAGGAPALELRSALEGADRTRVAVLPGSEADLFSLAVGQDPDPDSGGSGRPARELVADLSLDPASPRYAPARIAEGFPGSPLRLTARDLRPAPRPARLALGEARCRSLPYVHPAQTGQIAYPLARFARLVRQTPSLRRRPSYRRLAESCLEAAAEAVAVHDEDWAKDGLGRGRYRFAPGAPVRFDGADLPINQSLALGRVHQELAAITGDELYRERSAALARWFRAALQIDAGGAYVWPYAAPGERLHEGWSADERVSRHQPSFEGLKMAEDVSHAHIDLAFATADARTPGGARIFDEGDLARFGDTFTANVARHDQSGRATTARDVAGGGGLGAHDEIAAAWLTLGQPAAAIFDHMRRCYSQRHMAPSPAAVFGCAHLNRHAASRLGAPEPQRLARRAERG